jgi:glucose-1-phosphatase
MIGHKLICYNFEIHTGQVMMNKKIKAVIFDMGGVILRTVDPSPRTAMAKRYGTTQGELEKYIFRGPTSVQSEKGLISDICHWDSILKHFDRQAQIR